MSVCLGLDWSTRRIAVGVQKWSQKGSALASCIDPDRPTKSGEYCKMQGLTPFVRELECARFYVPDALQLISDTLQEAGATEGEITEIRIGRGPGNYTGIRQSIAVAIGLAAPGGLPVRAVNSGALLDVPPDPPSRGVWVMGDARRGWWWGGRLPNPVWKLARPEEWMRETEGACLLSSDPARLDGLQVTEAYPRISKLLSLEPEQCAEPVEPLYLHPAV